MKTHVILLTSFFLFGVTSYAEIDDARLKERLTGGVFELVIWKSFDVKSLGATDEQLYRVMMDIYREAEDRWPTLTPKTTEWEENKNNVEGVLACLPLCGDIPVKGFLLDYAASKDKETFTRTIALSSYLRVAEAKEAKDVLLRFLVGKERMDLGGRCSILGGARQALSSASVEKRAAIFESLYVALSREENKCNFHVYDDVLSDLSSDYANSRQRLAILQKLINAPPLCKADESVMPNLTAKLKELQKTRRTTNINTNLATVMSRDVPPVAEPPASPPPRPRFAVPLAVGGGVIAALALFWAFSRRRR